jgi:hypothetical protein
LRPDAKKLLEHPWLSKKVDEGKLTQIMTSKLPVEVTNTIRNHLTLKGVTKNTALTANGGSFKKHLTPPK